MNSKDLPSGVERALVEMLSDMLGGPYEAQEFVGQMPAIGRKSKT